jgi:ribosome modulation factor
VETVTATRVSLGLGCSDACDNLTGPLYMQMSKGYDECAVLPIPLDVQAWRDGNRTARKRADRAERRGYRFGIVERHRRADEIQRINLSSSERQGRPMSAGYHQRPSESPLPVYPCALHAVRTYGVEDRDGVLVAYLWLYRADQLALVSQILGHADHLENEIMYLLVQGVLEAESRIAADGCLVYNRFDSGTDGLRFFKTRLGFAPTAVDWQP